MEPPSTSRSAPSASSASATSESSELAAQSERRLLYIPASLGGCVHVCAELDEQPRSLGCVWEVTGPVGRDMQQRDRVVASVDAHSRHPGMLSQEAAKQPNVTGLDGAVCGSGRVGTEALKCRHTRRLRDSDSGAFGLLAFPLWRLRLVPKPEPAAVPAERPAERRSAAPTIRMAAAFAAHRVVKIRATKRFM